MYLSEHTPDTDGTDHCRICGQPIGASGCDRGSWVHVSTAPDRVVSTSYRGGVWMETRLANGVVWRRKRLSSSLYTIDS